MKHLQISRLLLCLLVLIITPFDGKVSARGTLGENYIGFEYGGVRPGNSDLRDLDSFITSGVGFVNFPVHENIDLAFTISGSESVELSPGTDVSTVGGTGGLNYHFSPDKSIDPFVGLYLGLIDTTVDNGVNEDTHDQFGFGVGGGVEFDLSERLSLSPSIQYARYEDADDFLVGASMACWIDKETFLSGGVGYGFDEGDLVCSIGLGFGF